MSKKPMKPISLAIGAAFVTSLAAGNVSAETNVDANPFAMNELSSGYMQLAYGDGKKAEGEGKCGEGKCGDKKGDKEGKCGEKKGDKEGKCGEKKGDKEGKCGEGKCGEKKGDKEKGGY